jgi:hypothetical protein
VIVVDPFSWRQKRFPLLRHIDLGDRLAKGNWIVMLHREGCVPCREALPAYVALAHDLVQSRRGCGVALVEIPPWKVDLASTYGSACLRGRLSDDHQWKVRTPLFLSLNAGRVVEVTSNPDLLIEKERGIERAQAALERSGLLSFPDYRLARRNRYLGEIACGPLSLLVALRLLGLDISLEKEDKLIAEAGDRGIDLLRLKELAEGEGVHAVGVELTSSDLGRIGLPAVIHDGRFGFAAVTDYSTDGVRIVRPFKPVVIFSSTELTQYYGSSIAALLVSRQPIDLARLGVMRAEEGKIRGPWLRPERTVVSVGRVYKRAWEATLKLKNAGDAPLRIRDITAGCPGVKARVDVSMLQPGETTPLRVNGMQEHVGTFTCNVEISTNETFRKTAQIPVRGYVEQAVWLEPPTIVLDRVLPKCEVAAKVGLGVADGFSPDKVRVRIPEGAPLEGKIGPGECGSPCLILTWRGAATPGWHRYTVQLEPRQTEGYLATPLPVAVHVVPAVEVFPESVWLRDAEVATSWSRRLTARLARPEELRVVIADENITKALLLRMSSNGEGEHTITLDPRSSGALAPFKGRSVDLVLMAGNETIKKVPITLGAFRIAGQKEAPSLAESPK